MLTIFKVLEKLSDFIPKLKRANDGQQDVNVGTPIDELVKCLIGAWLLQTRNQDCIEDVDESKPYIQLVSIVFEWLG